MANVEEIVSILEIATQRKKELMEALNAARSLSGSNINLHNMDEATDYYMELQDRRAAQSRVFESLRDEEMYPSRAPPAQRSMMNIMAGLADSSSSSSNSSSSGRGYNSSQLRGIPAAAMPPDEALIRSIASGTRCRPEKTTFTHGLPHDVREAKRIETINKREHEFKKSIKKKKKKKKKKKT